MRLAVATARAPGSRAASARSAEETAYNDAWDAMRASDFDRAAAGFAHARALAPAGALADESAFWRAVALARATSSAGAAAAFRDMLRAYPASPRRGQASAMLGWLLVEGRQLEEAAVRFRAAVADPDEAVRASASQGLAALTR